MPSTPPPSPPALAALSPSKPGDDDDSADDLSSLCLYCHQRAPIYTCPGCFARTCSVACVKLHKKRRQCSGERDPTAYVKRSKLMTESGINRDFNFLTKMDRELTRRLEEDREVIEGGGGGGGGRSGGDGEEGERRERLGPQKKRELEKLLKERGTEVRWAPWEGFERAKENRTSFSKGSKVSWTVEWILAEDSSRRLREHGVLEHKQMVQTIRESSVLPEEWRNLKAVKCFLVLPSPANQKLCTMIPKSETLKQALRHQTVLEYPDVLLSALDNPTGWEVVDNRKIVVLEDGQAEGAEASSSQPLAENPEVKPSRKRNRGKRKAADMTAASGAAEGVVEEQQEREKQPAPEEKDSEPTGAPSSVSTQNEGIQEVPMTSATTTTAPDDGEPSTEPVSKKARTE